MGFVSVRIMEYIDFKKFNKIDFVFIVMFIWMMLLFFFEGILGIIFFKSI